MGGRINTVGGSGMISDNRKCWRNGKMSGGNGRISIERWMGGCVGGMGR